MENKEEIINALEKFDKSVDIPAILENYLSSVAKTGESHFPWSKLKPLFLQKLEVSMKKFYEDNNSDELPPYPNVENVKFEEMSSRILEAVNSFSGAPFTIQRLCELMIEPKRHYRRTDKFLRGIEKNVMVVSTVDPHGRKISSEPKNLFNGLDSNGHNNNTTLPGASVFQSPIKMPLWSTATGNWMSQQQPVNDTLSPLDDHSKDMSQPMFPQSYVAPSDQGLLVSDISESGGSGDARGMSSVIGNLERMYNNANMESQLYNNALEPSNSVTMDTNVSPFVATGNSDKSNINQEQNLVNDENKLQPLHHDSSSSSLMDHSDNVVTMATVNTPSEISGSNAKHEEMNVSQQNETDSSENTTAQETTSDSSSDLPPGGAYSKSVAMVTMQESNSSEESINSENPELSSILQTTRTDSDATQCPVTEVEADLTTSELVKETGKTTETTENVTTVQQSSDTDEPPAKRLCTDPSMTQGSSTTTEAPTLEDSSQNESLQQATSESDELSRLTSESSSVEDKSSSHSTEQLNQESSQNDETVVMETSENGIATVDNVIATTDNDISTADNVVATTNNAVATGDNNIAMTENDMAAASESESKVTQDESKETVEQQETSEPITEQPNSDS